LSLDRFHTGDFFRNDITPRKAPNPRRAMRSPGFYVCNVIRYKPSARMAVAVERTNRRRPKNRSGCICGCVPLPVRKSC
jgi:hypothetical protein